MSAAGRRSSSGRKSTLSGELVATTFGPDDEVTAVALADEDGNELPLEIDLDEASHYVGEYVTIVGRHVGSRFRVQDIDWAGDEDEDEDDEDDDDW